MRKRGQSGLVDAPSGLRLRAARKMAGLSMEELARRLGGIVTKQAIAKYEKGKMKPSPEVMERLSQVLNIPPEIPPGLALMAEMREELADQDFEAKSAAAPQVLRSVELGSLTSKRAIGPGAGMLSRLFRRPSKGERALVQEAELLDERFGAAPFLEQEVRAVRDVAHVFGPRQLDFASVRFRERSPIPAKLESALRYKIADQMNRLMAVEALLGERVVFRSPLEGMTVASAEDVERAAKMVRERWGLGASPIPNLLGLLEEKGISVCEVRGYEEFDGLSAAFGSRSVIVVNRDFPADRVRFTAAHELAHVLGGFAAGPETAAEGLCHEFAAAFLLPKEALARLMTRAGRKVTLAELAEVKESYGISIQAVMRRARSLELVTDRQHRRFREIFREKGWLEVEPVEYKGAEKAGRFRRMLNFAVAEDIIDLEQAAALAGVAPEEFKKDMGDVF